MATTQSRLSIAITRYMDFYGWTPTKAAKECEFDRGTMMRMLTAPDYVPTDPIRAKIVKGFKLKSYEDIWKDPHDVFAAQHEHSPPSSKDECRDLIDDLADPDLLLRGKPISPFDREMVRWVLGERPDRPNPAEFK